MKQIFTTLLVTFLTILLFTGCDDSSENTPTKDPEIGKPCQADQTCLEKLECNITTDLCEKVVTTILPGSLDARGKTVITDQDGNIYVAGDTDNDFEGAINHGQTDIFLIKYTPDFEKVWSNLIGTDKNDQVTKIAIDSNGNLYLTGQTYGTFSSQIKKGSINMILIKVSPEGEILFEKQWADDKQTHIEGSDILFDNSKIYITGSQGHLFSERDFFLAQLETDGTLNYLKTYGTNENDYSYAISADHNHNIILTGETGGTLKTGLTSENKYDIFLMKLTTDGTTIWTKQFGTSTEEAGKDIVIDQENNIYLTGYTFGNLMDQNRGANDIFLIKFDSDGKQLWEKQFGTETFDIGNCLVIKKNHLYLGSNGNPHINFRSLDIILKKFDLNGKEIWSKQIDTGKSDQLFDMTLDPFGTLHLTGYEKSIDSSRDEDLLIYSLTE